MFFEKLPEGNIALKTDLGIITAILDHSANIFPHPRRTDFILITAEANNQNENKGQEIAFNSVTQNLCFPRITAPDRDEMIRELSKYFFSPEKASKILFPFYLKDAGSNIEMTGDYSSAPVDFIFDVAAQFSNDTAVRITDFSLYISDNGSFDVGNYGNGIGLTNGVQLFVEQDGVQTDMFQGIPVQTNGDFYKRGYEIELKEFGAGENILQVNVNLTSKYGGNFLRLDGRTNDKLILRMNDDFTALNQHSGLASGYVE